MKLFIFQKSETSVLWMWTGVQRSWTLGFHEKKQGVGPVTAESKPNRMWTRICLSCLQHCWPSRSFCSVCAHNSEGRIAMAATLGLLKPLILSGKPLQCYSKLKIPSNPTKLNVSVDSTTDPQILLPHSIHALKSASLPLTALAIPFFLDPNASSASLVLACSLLDLEFLTFLGSIWLNRKRLLSVGSLEYWREGHLRSYTPSWWVVCFSTPCGLGIWVGNGGESGRRKMRSTSSRSRWNLPRLLQMGHQWKRRRLRLTSKFSNSLR